MSRREENRDKISELAKKEFQDNMPARLSLHWDGKLLADLTGDLREMEAILVCGSPEYLEGKLLGIKQNILFNYLPDKNCFQVLRNLLTPLGSSRLRLSTRMWWSGGLRRGLSRWCLIPPPATETLSEQSRSPMTVLRGQSSWLPTTASPSPRTARRGAKSTRWWRQRGGPSQMPIRTR